MLPNSVYYNCSIRTQACRDGSSSSARVGLHTTSICSVVCREKWTEIMRVQIRLLEVLTGLPVVDAMHQPGLNGEDHYGRRATS